MSLQNCGQECESWGHGGVLHTGERCGKNPARPSWSLPVCLSFCGVSETTIKWRWQGKTGPSVPDWMLAEWMPSALGLRTEATRSVSLLLCLPSVSHTAGDKSSSWGAEGRLLGEGLKGYRMCLPQDLESQEEGEAFAEPL